ncbi:PREDICTED: cyclin-D3-1-like [Populus euphratica]|uniref:B-like cyclin n=1 Tax=Populus euphratica TaxID=75702 RepID=A0AAJ6SXE8_POPEU|nr:PREDICTED: cyclin-D3-1-like [Populus euphratica]
MAIPKQQELEQNELNSQQEQNASFQLDALYCEEGRWEDESEEEVLQESTFVNDLFPLSLLEQDLFWEDEELLSLFSKEEEQQASVSVNNVADDPFLSRARQEAVEWMLKVIAHYGFSTLTSILAFNYLDRFLSGPCYQRDSRPWMIQLVAVTCLSLAAKVEETHVPFLLDLQVEDTKYVFEAITIQRMELLVLSTLKWKMHPVTPLPFLDHIIRRLGLKTHVHWEFLRRCEHLLLSVVSDSRSVSYLPSVLATATMMHVIDQVESFNPIDYQNQLLEVLKITKEKVNGCYGLILELSRNRTTANNKSQKRKFEPVPSSPSGVIGAVFSSDSSNDSWAVQGSSVSSSPEPLFKKSRTQDKWVFADIVSSPPSSLSLSLPIFFSKNLP